MCVCMLIDVIESAREDSPQSEICRLPGGGEGGAERRRVRCEGAVSARPGVSFPGLGWFVQMSE